MVEQRISGIPVCPAEELTAFVQGLGPCDPDGISFTPFARGYHSEVYFCEGGPEELPEKFVLRHPKDPSGAAAMEADYEVRERLLNGLRVPRVLYFGRLLLQDTFVPVMLEEYVDGGLKDFATLERPEIEALAQTVGEIHGRTSSC